MIRVLHVIDHLGLGGAQTAVLDMLRHRDRQVFDVEVAVMHGWGPFADALKGAGIKVNSLSAAKLPPAYVPNFLRLIREGNYDILHFHLQASNWLMKSLAALAGAPVRISHDHTSGDLKFRGVGSLLPDAFSHLFSTRVIAVSDGVRDFLKRWEAVPRESLVVIPNGVDDSTFRPASPEDKAAARQRLGLPAGAFVVGGMGRLAHEKNFSALAELAQRHERVVFVIAGSGPEDAMLKDKAVRLGVHDRVTFLGAVTDRTGFYHALDVFILPSLHEGLPMALLEAMASRVPVLASRLEGIAAALVEGEEGLLAEAGSIGELSEKLATLENDAALRVKLASAAQAKAAAQYSAARTARRVEAVYYAELGIAPNGGTDRYSQR